MRKQMINSLKVGDEVETQAVVLELNRAAFSTPQRAGDFFLRLTLGDVSGRVKAVMWEPPVGDEAVAAGDVVFLRGTVNEYHGLQVVVSDLRRLDPGKVNRAFFQPVSERKEDEMVAELKGICEEEIKNTSLRALLQAFFGDEDFLRKFSLAPAARTIHHNCVGGLLEHTLEVAALCRNLAELYPEKINRDLLLAGALLHDIGKLEEYRQDSLSFEFSDRGKLVGHISIGKEMLDRKLAGLPDFPADLKLELEHILLTHHGQRDWGSPEVPKTVNAFALFHADLVSARMNQFTGIMKNHPEGGGDWTEWDRFLERSIYVGGAKEEREDYPCI
ncbi:MAG: HD domain-containing protein [Firmicutes bacterium]|nr:HD domain-containing protein [Bacillota bacterium]